MRIIITDKEALESACLAEAQCCFTQAASTPILQFHHWEGLDNLSTGSQAFQQILDGTYNTSHIQDQYTVKLLTHLGFPPGLPEVLPRLDQEYLQGWRKA